MQKIRLYYSVCGLLLLLIVSTALAYSLVVKQTPEMDVFYSSGNFPEKELYEIEFGMTRQAVSEKLHDWPWYTDMAERREPSLKELHRPGCWRYAPDHELPDRTYKRLRFTICFDNQNRVNKIIREASFASTR